MKSKFPQYTTEYIEDAMSLRDPQSEAVDILDNIMQTVNPRKEMDIDAALDTVKSLYETCTDFERVFMSVTFALATAVGKTRLMGAFIAYLYTNYNIRNFFVVAPNNTIYEKLKDDFINWNSEKYVFKGLGCFTERPLIIKDDDYIDKNIPMFESDVHIFIFNIDKFNKDNVKMKNMNEMIGDTFYGYLSKLPDLVLIMDESHHYREEKGAQALNDLNPLMGLELTGTPYVKHGTKQDLFKNVVYEFPLSAAIAKGYTRTPYAVTRADIDFSNFGTEEMDKMMLQDGIICHENIKQKLIQYSVNNSTPENPVKLVKPFMLVVCKDTDHAGWVYDYVCSDEFRHGSYCNKTIIVHSKQRGSESEANTRLLLSVESSDNPVEIVIHVNMLKEGWDVNNLYTIVPLRTASSKILREQMVGRGLRLPFGERTGDKEIDSVMLTAHDKFDEILEEAQKGDSIFNAGKVIVLEGSEEQKIEHTQVELSWNTEEVIIDAYKRFPEMPESRETDDLIKKTNDFVETKVEEQIQFSNGSAITEDEIAKIAEEAEKVMSADEGMRDAYDECQDVYEAFTQWKIEKIYQALIDKYIPIPQIRVIDAGEEEYRFVEFDLDLEGFSHVPVENELLLQSLEDPADRERIKGDEIDFEGYNPEKAILDELRRKPEIDYEKCSGLLFKLITQACAHYVERFGSDGMLNVVMMNKRDIGQKVYEQMMNHFYSGRESLVEEVSFVRNYDIACVCTFKERTDLFGTYESPYITQVLFDGIKKGVFSSAKFDSVPELKFARILETDDDVLNWLRPAPKDFNITYNNGKNYEPDFVVVTNECTFLVEVKAKKMMDNLDVVAKKERALKYCEVVCKWEAAHGGNPWEYLFIPDDNINANSTFVRLAKQFPA